MVLKKLRISELVFLNTNRFFARKLGHFPMSRIFELHSYLLLLLVLLGLRRNELGMGLIDIYRSSRLLGCRLCMNRLIPFALSIP